MFGRTGHKGTIGASSYRKAKDVVFLELQHTTFCAECELISYNSSSRCLACGSMSVLSLARVLGGSLRGEQRTRLVTRPAETIDAPKKPFLVRPLRPQAPPDFDPAYALAMHATGSAVSMYQFGVDRTSALTQASGAAIAMKDGPCMVCQASTGVAPEVGAEVPEDGLTALCARTGQLWRCNDTEKDPWVNRDSCRQLGVRSIVVAPVLALRKVIGILEVFSPSTGAFTDDRAATVQLMASAIALANLRNSSPPMTPGPSHEHQLV